jgi:TonB family protein
VRTTVPAHSLRPRAIIISTIIHLLIFASFYAVPELRIPLQERPIRVVWVELPKGTSDEIGLGIKESKSLPKSTIEEQKRLYQPETPEQTPLEVKPPSAKKEEIKVAEKGKPGPRPKMMFDDKTKVRRAEAPTPPANKKISQALAMIDKQLAERTVVPEAAQIGGSGEGYKYGTGTTPLKVLPSDPEYLKYQAQVRWKIMHEWVIPEKFVEEGGPRMNARLEVMINMDGDVVSLRWASRSGNESFDQSALRAVKKSSPFPKPPDRLAWEAYNEGFLIEFDPRIKAKY